LDISGARMLVCVLYGAPNKKERYLNTLTTVLQEVLDNRGVRGPADLAQRIRSAGYRYTELDVQEHLCCEDAADWHKDFPAALSETLALSEEEVINLIYAAWMGERPPEWLIQQTLGTER
jgi:hypothetical protein